MQKEKTEKIERIIINSIILIFIPLIIGVLFYYLFFKNEGLLVGGGLAAALAISIAGLLLTVMHQPRKGAFFINGGIIGFMVQYVILLSKSIEPELIWLLGFITVIVSSSIYLINVQWLGTREKISHNLYIKLSKGGSIIFLLDSLIIIVYSSYSWWFKNIFSSLGLGMIIIGAILPLFRYLISSRKMIYFLSMLPINGGISLMIFGGLYVAVLNLSISLFLTCMIGFFLNLLINFICSKTFEILSDIFWNKLFFIDFLSISIFGSIFFSLLNLEIFQKTMIAILWFNASFLALVYFAYKGELISKVFRDKLWLIGAFGINFELSFIFTLAVYSIDLFLAIGTFSISFGALMILFNFLLNKRFLYYINSGFLAFGFSLFTATIVNLQYLDLINAIFWGLLVVNCVLIGILLFGLLRKFLEKLEYYKWNFYSWISLSFIIGFLVGWNTYNTEILFFLGLLTGSFVLPFSLIWAKAGGIIEIDQFYRLLRIVGSFINLQFANIFSLFILKYPNGWIGYLATFMIIFGCLNYLLLIKIKDKRYILFSHILSCFGISLLLSWVNFLEDFLLNFVFSVWIGLTVFLIIIPISFSLDLASRKILYRMTFVYSLLYMLSSTILLNSLIPTELATRNYLIIMFITFMLFMSLHFGSKGEFYFGRIFYILSTINLSVFIITFCLFSGTLLWIDPFYRITFILLFVFILLIPDLYFLSKAELLKETYYRKLIEIIVHILSGISAIILAGIPILIIDNWLLGFGIFFTVFPLLSGFIHLYYKRKKLFLLEFCIFFFGFFIFLHNVLIFLVIDFIATIFWALSINLIVILFMLDFYKYYKLLSLRPARLGILISSLSLSFTISFLVEWYLLVFGVLSIISSILLFLLLSRIIILYIDANNLFPKAPRNFPLLFSLWSCIITSSLFVYVLLNTLYPSPYTLGFQLFNITFISFLFIGLSCVFSKAFRNVIIKGIIALKDAFIKLITNQTFLTVLSTSTGCLTAVFIYIYYENLFLGINLAILIILICWKAIFYQKSFANYFIIGVPVVLGVIFYKFLLNIINLYYDISYFDNLYIILYSIGISALIFFIFSYTFWKFKSGLKFGLFIAASVCFIIPLIYNCYLALNPLLLTFTEFFLIIMPWLISVVLINTLWFSYYFKKHAGIFLLTSFSGLFSVLTLISFNLLFTTLSLPIRIISSCFTSAGASFFILSILTRYYKLLEQKWIAITLGISVISSSFAVGSLLYFYQGVDLLISFSLAIDFGIFLYYLSLICYLWKLSKEIWAKGWYIWIVVPVVNAILTYLCLRPLGSEFMIFGIFLAISIGHILFLPIVFYRWRSNFRLSWFIIWAESIPLSFSAAYFFWFKEFFFSAIFTMGIITILLAVFIYFIKMWKLSAILWSGLSIGNGLLFFISGFGVINLIALVGISLIIFGLQATIVTIFPTIPKKLGIYIWVPASSGITILAVYFAQISHFDIFLTVFFAGLICLLSLYPFILFGIDKKWIYKIIGFGACLLLPLFTYFLLFNTLAVTIIDEIARALISASISMIITGFILLLLHRFEILKREYWFISWTILSASIAALFSWFGFYVFYIIDNITNLMITLLIFEIILIPASHKFWKILGQTIIFTISVLLGFLIHIYFGIALCLIFSAIFLEFQKPLVGILRKIQDPLLAVGLFFLLFWGLQIIIYVIYAFLISIYVILFYPFLRSIMTKRWLIATLFWIGLIMGPAAIGVLFALNSFTEMGFLQSILIYLCTLFSLGLALPAFHEVSKKITAILWIALGCSLSIFLYSPLIYILLEPFPTILILIMLLTSFFAALPLFDFPPKLFFISITVLSIEVTALLFNYIYFFTSEDLLITTVYALLIESIILIGLAFWQKKWTISMLFWYSISVLIGLIYFYYASLILGVLTWTEYMMGLLIIGSLIGLPIFSSKLGINERFLSYLIFTIVLTISITYYSSIIFVGEMFFIYIISFACFLFSSLLLIFYRVMRNLIQTQSFLDRFYKSSFWILFSIFSISASILVFWCFYIRLSLSFELSLSLSLTSGIGVIIGGTFWQNYNKLVKFIYIPLTIVISFTIYFALIDILILIPIYAFLIAFLAWGNLLVVFAFLPEMEWQIFKYIWIIIASCFSFVGAYVIWLNSLALIPCLMIGLIIFSAIWIKPPLAPPDFSYRMYLFSIIIISANICLGWAIIVLFEMGIIIGILIPSLIGNLLILILALYNIIDKKYWKKIYLLIPIIGVILCLFIFYSYEVIDIYLNTFIPILIGLGFAFPLVIEYSPFKFLTKNAKILVISIAVVSFIITFLVLGYFPFITGQTLLKGVIAAIVFILIIYSILPKAFEFTEFTYLYIAIGAAAGVSTIILLFLGDIELWKKLILIFLLSAGAACLGNYKIVEKKAEQNPQLSSWRLVILIVGFIAVLMLAILLIIFLV